MKDEYIRKEEVSDWLKQYGQDVLHEKYKFSLMYIWKNIMNLPSADVIPVVRCKDCKHWESGNFGFNCCWDPNYPNHGDDFCSHGEKCDDV